MLVVCTHIVFVIVILLYLGISQLGHANIATSAAGSAKATCPRQSIIILYIFTGSIAEKKKKKRSTPVQPLYIIIIL